MTVLVFPYAKVAYAGRGCCVTSVLSVRVVVVSTILLCFWKF